MRFTCFAIVYFTPLLCAISAESNIRLTGLVSLAGYKRAVLEDPIFHRSYVLAEGERDDALEVKEISPTQLTATISHQTNQILNLTLDRTTNPSASPTPTIVLEKVNFRSAIRIFQELCNRTVLQHPQTPDSPFSLQSSAANREDALRDFQIALTNKAIVIVSDGEKFVMIGPDSAASTLIPRSTRPQSTEISSNAQSANGNSRPEEVLPPGTIDFRGAGFDQVFQLYAFLVDHKIDQTHPFQGPVHGNFVLHSQSPLSKSETIYIIGTLINWRGVNIVTQSDGSITAVSSSR